MPGRTPHSRLRKKYQPVRPGIGRQTWAEDSHNPVLLNSVHKVAAKSSYSIEGIRQTFFAPFSPRFPLKWPNPPQEPLSPLFSRPAPSFWPALRIMFQTGWCPVLTLWAEAVPVLIPEQLPLLFLSSGLDPALSCTLSLFSPFRLCDEDIDA